MGLAGAFDTLRRSLAQAAHVRPRAARMHGDGEGRGDDDVPPNVTQVVGHNVGATLVAQAVVDDAVLARGPTASPNRCEAW
jgi:hypothetical protein